MKSVLSLALAGIALTTTLSGCVVAPYEPRAVYVRPAPVIVAPAPPVYYYGYGRGYHRGYYR